MGRLRVGFIDTEFVAGEERRITFGTTGDVVLDAGPPCTFGAIEFHSGYWWIEHHGGVEAFVVADRCSTSRLELAGGATSPLPFESSEILLKVGSAHFAIDLEVELDVVRPAGEIDERLIALVRSIEFNEDQLRLIDELCARRRRNPMAIPAYPPNVEMAERLGWRITQFNRKLDHLCGKLDKAGVPGLRGSRDHLASDRRLVLTELALAADLGLVEA